MSDQARGDLVDPQGSMPEPEPPIPEGKSSTGPSAPGRPAVEPMWQVIRRLPAYARLSAALARDSRVPGSAKAMLAAGGVYLVSPIDLVPGIIPVAGQLDDLYVVLAGLRQAIRKSPDDVVDEHFAAAGLERSCVDDDLATIRVFVRRGVVWSLYKGRRALARCSRQVTALAQRARQRGESSHDQRPL